MAGYGVTYTPNFPLAEMPTDIYYAALNVFNVCTVGAMLYLWVKMNYIRPFHIYFPIRVKFGIGNLRIMLLNISELRKTGQKKLHVLLYCKTL